MGNSDDSKAKADIKVVHITGSGEITLDVQEAAKAGPKAQAVKADTPKPKDIEENDVPDPE